MTVAYKAYAKLDSFNKMKMEEKYRLYRGHLVMHPIEHISISVCNRLIHNFY